MTFFAMHFALLVLGYFAYAFYNFTSLLRHEGRWVEFCGPLVVEVVCLVLFVEIPM
jgi:hypothetical protein